MVQRILPVTTCYVGTQDAKKGFAFAKRAFDIVVSLVMIVALLPLLLVLAAISAVDTKGCPLFAQTRMGRNNQPFKMLKFRTMNVNAPMWRRTSCGMRRVTSRRWARCCANSAWTNCRSCLTS